MGLRVAKRTRCEKSLGSAILLVTGGYTMGDFVGYVDATVVWK